MASVTVMRQALKETIQEGLGDQVMVYDTVPGIASLPAIVVEPAKANFELAMGRGTDEWYFNVFILASRRDEELGQNELDPFISGAGPQSIRQIIFQNSSIGLSDSTAVVKGMRGYGGTSKEANFPMVGAVLSVCVFTDGNT